MSEMNNTLGGINNRIDIAGGKVSGLEGLAVEAISVKHRENRTENKRIAQSLMRWSHAHATGDSKEEEGTEKYA